MTAASYRLFLTSVTLAEWTNVWTVSMSNMPPWWSSAVRDTLHCAQTSSGLTGWVTHIGVSEGNSGDVQALINSGMTELSVNTGAASTSKSSLLLFQDLYATGVGLIWWVQSNQGQMSPLTAPTAAVWLQWILFINPNDEMMEVKH